MASFGDGIMQYFAKIGLDTTEFIGGLTKADSGILKFYRDVSISMGATMFVFDKVMQYGQKFIDLANSASEYVSTLDKLSITTGLNNEELQRWSNVARYADSDISSLSSSLRKFQLNLNSSGDEGKKARAILDSMGISYKNADGSLKSMTELFPETIAGIADLSSSADRVTAANTLFGRSYQELAGYMTMTKSEMEGYYSSANTLTEEQQGKLRDYEKATKDLNASITELSNTAGSELSPSFTEFSQLLNDMAGNESIIAFFSGLNVFLTDVARGFHIIGSEAQIAYDVLTFNSTAADKDKKDLDTWISQKSRDDAMKAAGYKTDGYGNVIAENTTPKGTNLSTDTNDETKAIEEKEDALKSLTSAQEDYNSALEKMQDVDKNFSRDLLTTNLRDVAAVRNLNIQHNYNVEDQTAAINKAASSVKSEKIKYEITVNLDSKKIATSKGEAAGASTERSNIRAGVTT